MSRDRATAKHEAAHIVVGVAAGLRMRRAVLRAHATPTGNGWFDIEAGHVLFEGNPNGPHREALALMYAAGVAWEKGDSSSAQDRALLRTVCSGRHAERAFIRAARSMLFCLTGTHARVAEALTHRDLTGADITAIARGEKLE